MRYKLTGVVNQTRYQFSIIKENQSLTDALSLDSEKILGLKRFIINSADPVSDLLDVKEIIQKRKESQAYIDDIIAEEIFYHYQHHSLPLGSSLLAKIAELSEKVRATETHFLHLVKKIFMEIQTANTFDAKEFPDHQIDLKDIKSVIAQKINQCEEKKLSALNATQLRSLQGYAFIYLLYRYPDKSILEQEDYIQFMGRWMALQNAKQDLQHFLTSASVIKAFLGNKLGARILVVDSSQLEEAKSKVILDPTNTSEIIYKNPTIGWCLYNKSMPDDASQESKALFPSLYTKDQVQQFLKQNQDAISDKNNKNKPTNKEINSLTEIKNMPPQLALLSSKNSEGKTTALASLIDAAASCDPKILVIWQRINSKKIQPIHYFNPDFVSSAEVLTTIHLLAVSPYEKIILQTGEPALNENEKKSSPKTLELYQSISKEVSEIIIKDGNKITYVNGTACQALLTYLQEIQLTFPTAKSNKIVVQDLLQVQQITMLCGLTTFHILKAESQKPYYQSRFDKKPLPLGLEDCDFQLMSLEPDINVDVDFFKHFTQPTLIKQNQNFSLYGRNEQGNWHITTNLNAKVFQDLTFPELELKITYPHEYDFHAVFIRDEDLEHMPTIRKQIIKNTADNLPFLVHKDDGFFIYGQVKYGKWQLSEKLDNQPDLKWELKEEEKDSPMALSQKGFRPLPMKTCAGGDCALHAILGSWDPDSGQIYCQEVIQRREELKKFLLEQSNSLEVKKLVTEGITALIMAGGNAGQHTQSLQKEYQRFCLTHDEKQRENWQRLHQKINQYSLIVNYIEKNHGLTNSNSFLHQFHSALNAESSTLSARMLSLPELWATFQKYNQLQEFDWSTRISEEIRNEYLNFVCQPRTWLLPCELALIAKAFQVRVLYYPCAGATPEIFNEDEKITIAVQFDGQNHYERLNIQRYYRLLPKNQALSKIYREIASKKWHHFFNVAQTTVSSEKIPDAVYEEIAAKKAHFPKFPRILYHVNHNMKQKKRKNWAEQFFYLTVDAFLRAAAQKEYFPWIKTLLGPPLQKYASGAGWINPASDIAVIKKYEGQILQALIDYIAKLEIEDNQRIMKYAEFKWQETWQKTKSELEILCGESENSIEEDKYSDENDFKKDIQIQNLKRTQGLMEGLLEKMNINSFLLNDPEAMARHWQNRLIKAKAEWLKSDFEERSAVSFSLREKMREHLFQIIKIDYSAQIKKGLKHQADKQSSSHFEHFFLDIVNNFIHIHHEKRINLLLRFISQFLNHVMFYNFSQNWNWRCLVNQINQEIKTGFRHHHPEDSFKNMLARQIALDNFTQDGYLKKMAQRFEHSVNTKWRHPDSEETLDDMLTRKEIKKTYPSSQPVLIKPADLCHTYQNDSITWLKQYLTKDNYLPVWLNFSESSLTRLMKSILSTEIDFSPLKHIRELSTGNTLLHVALLRYRQAYVQEPKSLNEWLKIIQELFIREACFTALNKQNFTPWHFAKLTDLLDSEHESQKLNLDYELLLAGFQNLPLETEVSYVVINGLIQFLQASTQQMQSPIRFSGIKEGKAHRIKIVIHVLDEYLKRVNQQNDQVLRVEICKIISQRSFPSGYRGIRQGGDSMLLKIAKQAHKLMKQIAPEGEPIRFIEICNDTHLLKLEDNTLPPRKDVIYLIPNADNFTVDAQWINNTTWYHAKFRKEYELSLTPTKNEKLEFGKLYLNVIQGNIAYSTKISIDNEVKNFPTQIKAPTPFDLAHLIPLKETILQAASKAGHTSHKKVLSSIIDPWYLTRFKIKPMPKTLNSTLKSGVLYFEKTDLNNLAYKTLNKKGKMVEGAIEIKNIINTNMNWEALDIEKLNFFLTEVLNITHKNGHTPAALTIFDYTNNPEIVKQIASLCHCRVTPYYLSAPVISFNEDLPALVESNASDHFPITLPLTYTYIVKKIDDDKDNLIRKLQESLEEKDNELKKLTNENSNLIEAVNKLRQDWKIRDDKYEKEKKDAEELRQKEKAETEALQQKEKAEAEALRQKEKAEAAKQNKKLEEQVQNLMATIAEQTREFQAQIKNLIQMTLNPPISTPLTQAPGSNSPPSLAPSSSSASSSSSMFSSTTSSTSEATGMTSDNPTFSTTLG